MCHKATAIAHSNIALIKYWGKRRSTFNIPAVGSISLTLQELFTQTKVRFDPSLKQDMLILNGKRSSHEIEDRASRFLDLIRRKSDLPFKAQVVSHNNFPTGAGLASSASAFAALALAGSKAAGKTLTKVELSQLARLGSGSAARSIYGGFVEMKTGRKLNGQDAVAVRLAKPDFWPIKLLIVITTTLGKGIGSSQGMDHSKNTSPYYSQWIKTSVNDLAEMRLAIRNKDFEKMGELAEYSCLKMHSLCFSARPALIYWNQLTIELMHYIRELRNSGLPAYFTIDAGPQVKVLTLPEYGSTLRKKLHQVPGIKEIIETGPGPDAKVVEVRQ